MTNNSILSTAGYVTDASMGQPSGYGQIPDPQLLMDDATAAAGAAGGTAQGGGTPWLQYGLGAAGAGLMALPLFLGKEKDYSGLGNFQQAQELQSQIDELDRLLAQFRSPEYTRQAAQPLLNGVSQLAGSNAAAAGIEGPLAASLAGQAQTNLVSSLEQRRLNNLMAVLQQRAGLAELAMGARERYAQAIAEWRQMMAQRRGDQAATFGKIGGTVLGGIVGTIATPYTGGTVNTANGAAMGGSLGGALGGLLAEY